MCGCTNKISGMKRNYKKALKKSTTVTVQDILSIAAGGAIALATNVAVNKVTANMDETKSAGLKKIVPFAKVAVGGYLFLESDNRMAQFAGAGVVGVGAVETLAVVAPKYFALSGTEGDELFNMLGSSDESLFLDLDGGSVSNGLEDEAILGMENEYEHYHVL